MNAIKTVLLSLGLLFLAAAPLQASSETPQVFIENPSPANLPETIKAFKEEVKAAGWSILHVHNLAGVLSTKGHTLAPAMVFEVCSGKYSAILLAKDEHRYVTSMIPCRVAIYQTSKGNVVISRMNTQMLAQMLTPEVAEVVITSSQEMEGVIQRTLAKLQK